MLRILRVQSVDYNSEGCTVVCLVGCVASTMQFHLISGFLIFLGSYLPLAIILAIQDIPATWWDLPLCSLKRFQADQCVFNPFTNTSLALIFLAITTTALITAWLSLRLISYPFTVDVRRSKATPNEIINYTFPYVVSFMGMSYGKPENMLGFGVFLLWMFAITYKSGQILMNPLLLMFGWRLYEATIVINGEEKEVRVLKSGDLVNGVQKAQTIQDFYILRNK